MRWQSVLETRAAAPPRCGRALRGSAAGDLEARSLAMFRLAGRGGE